MTLIQQLIEDVGDIGKYKQIRPFDLKSLGYKFSKKKIFIRTTGFILWEILDEDYQRPVSFCFLYDKAKMLGIVIAFQFEKYFRLALAERKEVKAKEKKKSPNSRPGS